MASNNQPKMDFKRGDTFTLDLRVRDRNTDEARALLEELDAAQLAVDNDPGVDPQTLIDAEAAYNAKFLEYEDQITVDITNWVITSQIRRGNTLVSEVTVTITDAVEGFFNMTVAAELTQEWKCGKLECDIQFVHPTSGVISSETFIINVERDITKPTS